MPRRPRAAPTITARAYISEIFYNEDWGSDAAEALAPDFAAIVPPDRFAGRVRQRVAALAPIAVTGLDVGDHTARARVRGRDGSVYKVSCAVAERAPHRITSAATMALVPSFTAPRLPADFSGSR
jgi:hypothetical protein